MTSNSFAQPWPGQLPGTKVKRVGVREHSRSRLTNRPCALGGWPRARVTGLTDVRLPMRSRISSRCGGCTAARSAAAPSGAARSAAARGDAAEAAPPRRCPAGAAAPLAEEPGNGYQLMQTIEQRSEGVWRPSPARSTHALPARGRGPGALRRGGGRAAVRDHRRRPGALETRANKPRRGTRRTRPAAPPATSGR